jgi:type II secretory pathway predicted ATPase ExeA/phage tail protein X
MFLEHYNLAEQPFGVTPDPRFLYLNRMYREALASLWYGVKEGRGFMALVAQPGMGKTTLLFQLLQRLRTESARTVFLFQTCCNSLDLIRYLLQDMGILPAYDLASMHQQLNDALVREVRAGKQFVFVIDEAQNLSASVLETVRLLSDFETSQGKLLQIILAGQPHFLHTLNRPEMLQLRQRISVTTSLDPLDHEEVAHYVEHRLAVAGYQGPPLFSRGALQVISHESQGIPRNINNLCFGALSAAFALQRKAIDRKIAEEVAADQNFERWQERIEHRAAVPGSGCEKGLPGAASLPSFSRVVQSGIPRTALLAVVAGLLMLAGILVWSRKPEPASRALSGSRPTATLMGPSLRIAPPTGKALSEAVTPGHEMRPPAVLAVASTVIVRSGDDLRSICLQHLGRYSTGIVQQIQRLNPELVDPNRIEVGQEIRLPLRGQGLASTLSDENSQPSMAALRK